MHFSKSELLVLENITVISGTTVEGALYGFSFALYIFCARSLYLQLQDQERRRQHLSTLLYMSLVVALALTGVAVDSRDVQLSYVDNVDYPGGSRVYSNDVFQSSPVAIMGYVTALLFTVMMSGIEIWRLWVVWRATRYCFLVVVLPALSLLAFTVLQIIEIVMLGQRKDTPRLDKLGYIVGIAFPLFISIIVTVLITGRIAMARRRHTMVMGQTEMTTPYTSIISMLVESFALESVWMTIQLIVNFSAVNVGTVAASDFFVGTQPFIQLLSYLLVVYRVNTGRGWKEDTAEKLTTLQWNRDRMETTQTRASIPISREEA